MTKNHSTLSSVLDALNNSVGEAESPLIAAYKTAVKTVCGVTWVALRNGDTSRFASRQKELDDEGIDYGDYTASVVKTWWGWCQLLHMNTVPASIFCGQKALSRYLYDKERHKYVSIDTVASDEHHERIAEEMDVVLLYLSGYPFSTLLQVRDLLSEVHKYPPSPEIAAEVLELYNAAYGLDAGNYDQLVEQHRRKYNIHGTYSTSTANQKIQIEGVSMSIEPGVDA